MHKELIQFWKQFLLFGACEMSNSAQKAHLSIYDIAKIAEVSPTTVSKVINGRYGVSEKTHKKVQEVLNQTGFMPKISVNHLNYIAVIYSSQKSDIFESHFTQKVLKGIDYVIHNSDYYLTLLPFKVLPASREEFTVFCHRQRIAGCIFLAPIQGTESCIVTQISGVVPFVILNERYANAQNTFSVTSNDYFGAYRAVTHMIEYGHRRIAMAAFGSKVHMAHDERKDAYTMALKSHGINLNQDYLFDAGGMTYEEFYNLVGNWEKFDMLPTAIFCVDDSVAFNLLKDLQRMGKRVPEDISVVGIDDYDYDTIFTPNLTTVRQKLFEKGQKAAGIIVDVLAGELVCNEDTKDIVFETELVIRDSVQRL